MAQDDPGALGESPQPAPGPHDDFTQILGGDPDSGVGASGAVPPRRRRVLPLLSAVLAVVALVLAFIPYACFAAGLPALAAIVLGFVGLVTQGRRALAAVGLVVGAVALVAAITVSAVQITRAVTRFADDAGEVVPQLPGSGATRAPGLAAGVHRITYAVTGDGRASISYSALVNGERGVERESDVAVPHARTQRVTVERSGGSAEFVMIVVASDVTKSAGCTISIDGKVVAARNSNASSGGSGFVTCTARTDS